MLVGVGVAISLVNRVAEIAPLVLLSGGAYLTPFTPTHLEALALASLRFNRAAGNIATAFWGLRLFPFGILVVKSRFLPAVLGVLLMVAGLAYLVTSGTALVLPGALPKVSRIMMPLYFGEIPIIFWLLIKGTNVRTVRETLPMGLA